MHFTDTDEEFSNGEESVIMLPHLRELHLNKTDNPCSPVGLDEDAASITSDYTKPVPVNIFEDADMRLVLLFFSLFNGDIFCKYNSIADISRDLRC